MQLSDHIRTLLRDHDCVIIPDFGGLIADYAPAQVHPVRHTLAPPTKRVAFNQSLTRNDGLLVDALSQSQNISVAQARQLVREAVRGLQQDLETGQRTELPGIGIFRRSPGRGLDFEYTGSQNLLSASYGLPELVARPIRATDALLARDRQPVLPQLAAARARRTMKRLFNTASVVVIAGLILSANYMFALQMGYLPDSLKELPDWAVSTPSVSKPATPAISRQQAGIANNEWREEAARVEEAAAPAVAPAAKPAAPAATKPAARPSVAPKSAAPATVAGPSTINARTGRFYIIDAAFKSLKSAEKGRVVLSKHGHPAKVILPQRGSRNFYLSAADFADRASAERERARLAKKLGSAIWILNY
ncbi:hypothetical protein LJY25_00355 [Hymenobacter sp. BT175]|uniref:HU domain-containing protein n=1 Tax=Hymenobacter translucens TaxID=2886507 RepID=UPI001D0E54C3|nr:hypothetical protein [Hymenobacter translucens]MCC2544880.1 hypothetical protein [Hymenobacter translucens]